MQQPQYRAEDVVGLARQGQMDPRAIPFNPAAMPHSFPQPVANIRAVPMYLPMSYSQQQTYFAPPGQYPGYTMVPPAPQQVQPPLSMGYHTESFLGQASMAPQMTLPLQRPLNPGHPMAPNFSQPPTMTRALNPNATQFQPSNQSVSQPTKRPRKALTITHPDSGQVIDLTAPAVVPAPAAVSSGATSQVTISATTTAVITPPLVTPSNATTSTVSEALEILSDSQREAPANATPLVTRLSSPVEDDKKEDKDFCEVKGQTHEKKCDAVQAAEINQKSRDENDFDVVKKNVDTESKVESSSPEVTVDDFNDIIVNNNNNTKMESLSEPTSKSGSQIKLKYEYKDDQWSPINQDGRKQYDRDFLMMLSKDPLSVERPANLPLDLEIVKDSPRQQQFAGGNLFTSGFGKSLSQRLSVTKKGSRDGRSPASGPQKILEVKIEKVELHQTENAWRPDKLKASNATNGENQDEVEVLMRKARGILNKLCPQKFDILVTKFDKDLNIDTEEKLTRCIDLVYEKAVDEPSFSVAYAKMCEVMQKKQVMKTGPSGEQEAVNFRKILVTRCQHEFQRDYMHDADKTKYEADLAEAGDDEAKKKTIQAEWEEKEMSARRRSLGNIRFIGELYKLKMLTGRIMHECVNNLLSSIEEESLECLCRLLTTIGKDLETETNQKLPTANEIQNQHGPKSFDRYFNRINKIIQEKGVSSRVRFMLQDLVDLRKNKWVPRRDVAGPKTIDQIHEEVEKEKAKVQLMNDYRGGRDSIQGRGGASGAGNNSDRKKSGRPAQDDWSQPKVTQRSSTQYEKIDANKIANFAQSSQRRMMDGDPFKLAPGRNRWSTGSGGGTSLISTRAREDQAVNTHNKFALLSAQDNLVLGPSRSMGPPERQDRGGSVESAWRPNGPTSDRRPTVSAGQPDKMKTQADLLKGNSDLSEDDIERKSKELLEEYINNKNNKDAIEVTVSYFHPSSMATMTEKVINFVIEKSDAAIKTTGQLFKLLLSENLLLSEQFEEGVKKILEFAEDLITDFPKFWTYISELTVPSLVAKCLPLSFILDCSMAVESNLKAKYLVTIFDCLMAASDPDMKASIKKFVSDNKLESSLNWSTSSSPPPTIAAVSGLNSTEEDLQKLLQANPKHNDAIIAWIEKNIGDRKTEDWFIRSLTTAVAINIIDKPSNSGYTLRSGCNKDRMKLLKVYIDNDLRREETALYALQLLMQRLEHPNRLLVALFHELHNNDVITRNGFKAWQDCKDSSKQEGKGVCASSTASFFNWLEEDGNEEDEDESE